MKKNLLCKKVLSVFMVMLLIISSSFAGVGGTKKVSAASKVWSGRVDKKWYKSDLDYFEIETAEQLAGFAKLVNDGVDFDGVTICLTKDIVLNKTGDFNKWDKRRPKNKWKMIGSQSHPFRGVFNAQGHTISGLYIKDTKKYSNWYNSWYADAGLFGYVSGATIVNLKVKKAYLNVKGNIGVVSVCSQNSNFYGIEIDGVKCQNGNAGGIVCKATYDYTETYLNLFTVVATESIMAMGGVIINPLFFGDAIKLPNDFSGNVFFSCKVKNLNCVNTQTTGGIIALGGDKDKGMAAVNCFIMNYTVKSDCNKGMIMGVKPSTYAIVKNCYSTNSKIKRGSKNITFVDKKKVKILTKKKLIKSGAKLIGKAFVSVKGKEPKLKLFKQKKVIPDAKKYKTIEDGYYTITYGKSYMTVDSSMNVVMSSTSQKYYFQYQPGGYYTITNENGAILTGNSANDDVYAQKVTYNEHRFTQRWLIEKKGDSYYIRLHGTNKAISDYSGYLFFTGSGVKLDKDWLDDEAIGYNVIWNLNKVED